MKIIFPEFLRAGIITIGALGTGTFICGLFTLDCTMLGSGTFLFAVYVIVGIMLSIFERGSKECQEKTK